MKKIISFATLLLSINLISIGQTAKDYDQKASECFSKKDYKCVIENIKAEINLVGDNYGDLYLLYANLGTAQRRLGSLNEALDSYNKAFELRSNSSDVLYNRASLKRQMNDLEGSLNDYNQGLVISPNDRDLLLNRSVTRKMLKDTIGAENDLIKILEGQVLYLQLLNIFHYN